MKTCSSLMTIILLINLSTLIVKSNGYDIAKSQISFADLHGLQSLNCTSYIPTKVLALMKAYASDSSASDQTIPAEYLIKCLLNAEYDNRISAFYYMENPALDVNFALNEVMSLTFEGTLSSAVTLWFDWIEPRLTWNVTSDIAHWNWPSKVDINPAKLWLPIYFIHNCPTTSCVLPVDANTEIDITSDGGIKYYIMTVVQSTCQLNLDNFPFDEQKCNIMLDFDNSIPFHFTISTKGEGSALYYETCDEWLVTSFDYDAETGYNYAFKMSTSPTDWTITKEDLNYSVIEVHMTLVRTSSSDVYNLLAPVLRSSNISDSVPELKY